MPFSFLNIVDELSQSAKQNMRYKSVQKGADHSIHENMFLI